MKVCGIVVEYNPFHNGHIYHIEQTKQLVKPDVLIAIMSPTFMQRGEPAIINKYERTKFALKYGVDIVIELPSIYAMQSANYFAYGALKLLNELKITHLVFGSESNDIESLINAAKISNTDEYQGLVKKYVKDGQRYANACNLAFNEYNIDSISLSNDILGLAYTQEIVKHNYDIEPLTIKRSNNFLETTPSSEIASATSIRKLIKNNQDISKYTPMNDILLKNKDTLCTIDNLFATLKYKLTSMNAHEIREIAGFEEGLEYLFTKNIENSDNIEEFIEVCSSKRYPKTRIQRCITYLVCNIKKVDFENIELNYIRILGFNKIGQQYLKDVKNKTNYDIITTISNYNNQILDLEVKLSKLYSLFSNNEDIRFIDFSKVINEGN